MQHESEILNKAAHRDGMTVPEGYFAEFKSRMAAQLPARPELSVNPEETATSQRDVRTLFQRLRPYIYMAAMFAGIWLMLQMFVLISNPGDLRPMDSNPLLTEAFLDDDFMMDYFIDDSGIDQWDVLDQMNSDGTLDDVDFSIIEPDQTSAATLSPLTDEE